MIKLDFRSIDTQACTIPFRPYKSSPVGAAPFRVFIDGAHASYDTCADAVIRAVQHTERARTADGVQFIRSVNGVNVAWEPHTAAMVYLLWLYMEPTGVAFSMHGVASIKLSMGAAPMPNFRSATGGAYFSVAPMIVVYFAGANCTPWDATPDARALLNENPCLTVELAPV